MTPRAPLLGLAALALAVLPAAAQTEGDAYRASLERALATRDSGDTGAAIAALEELAARHPDRPAAHLELARLVHASGDHAAAIPLHRAAARFPEVRAIALYDLACALATTGRLEEAQDALARAVDAGFSDGAHARTDPELAPLRDDPRFEASLALVGVPIARAMDFWVGSWDCYDALSRALAGRNVLENRLGGRVVHERWTPVGGGSEGESWTTYDPATGDWRQTWVDATGAVLDFVGRRRDGGILFETERGASVGPLRRMLVRPVGEGRVRQTGTRSDDGGATWVGEYDLLYVPAGERLER